MTYGILTTPIDLSLNDFTVNDGDEAVKKNIHVKPTIRDLSMQGSFRKNFEVFENTRIAEIRLQKQCGSYV